MIICIYDLYFFIIIGILFINIINYLLYIYIDPLNLADEITLKTNMPKFDTEIMDFNN